MKYIRWGFALHALYMKAKITTKTPHPRKKKRKGVPWNNFVTAFEKTVVRKPSWSFWKDGCFSLLRLGGLEYWIENRFHINLGKSFATSVFTYTHFIVHDQFSMISRISDQKMWIVDQISTSLLWKFRESRISTVYKFSFGTTLIGKKEEKKNFVGIFTANPHVLSPFLLFFFVRASSEC